MKWWIIGLLALPVAGCVDDKYARRVNPESVSLPYSFIDCATRTAAKWAKDRPEMSYEIVAGFANAECQSELRSYIASLNLGYADNVYVTSSLNRRAEMISQKIAIDAKLDARRSVSAVSAPTASKTPVDPSMLNEEETAQIRKWGDCSVRAIREADRLGLSVSDTLKAAKMACGYMWSGNPGYDETLYAKILVSVKIGSTEPDFSVSPPVPASRSDRRI